MTDLVDRPELRLFLALGIGLLVGVERERSKGEGPSRGAAGQEGNNGKGNEKALGEHGEQYSVGVPA